MKAKVPFAALAALCLAGCATAPPSGASFVAPVASSETAPLVQAIVGFVTDHCPPGPTTLVLDPLPSDQRANALTPALTAALRARGYALAADASAAPTARHVQYLVTPLFDGLLVRVKVDHDEGSRLFLHDRAGALVADGPMTVRAGR